MASDAEISKQIIKVMNLSDSVDRIVERKLLTPRTRYSATIHELRMISDANQEHLKLHYMLLARAKHSRSILE